MAFVAGVLGGRQSKYEYVAIIKNKRLVINDPCERDSMNLAKAAIATAKGNGFLSALDFFRSPKINTAT